MRYIDSWLTGLGLEYIIPKLKANGITTPKKLALLTLRDMYEVVGVEDAEDRKKLYFLIQRLHTILNNKPENIGSPGNDNDDEIVENTTVSKSPPKNHGTKAVPDDRNEDDLRVLRRNKRSSIESSERALSSPKQHSLSENNQGGVPYEIKSSRSSKNTKESNFDYVETSMREINLREANDSTFQQSSSVAAGLRVKKSFAPPLDPPPPSPPRETVPTQSVRRLENNGRQRATKQPVVNKYDDLSPPASPPRVPPPPAVQRNSHASALSSRGAVASEAKAAPLVGKQSRVVPPPPVEPELDEEEEDIDDGSIVDMAIRVVVRKRPMSRGELNKGDRDVMDIARGGSVMVHEPKTKVDLTKVIETQKFTFDDAFDADETNEVIYSRTIKHLVSFVFDGGKASCFAYGQTGSGKTFSMMGSRPDAPAEATENAGLYVLAARDIFSYVKRPKFQHIKILVSCFEIYGGKLYDLLNNRGIVKCLEDSKQQVQLPGLTEHLVKNVGELLELMAQAHTQRSTGCTGANAESSRSHQVMQIVLRDSGPKPTVAPSRGGISSRAPAAAAPSSQRSPGGKLSFIDLAGSERGADTTHNSKQTRMEGAEINTSLLALKEVIRSLERKHGHTPFRGSKLTQVLKDSFVGDKTRTCMVACVSPSHSNCEHTLNTLRYADRVKEHQSGGSGGGAAAAHVSSSQYDSMAYDYVPPPKGNQVQDVPASRPQTASAASSGQNRSVASSSSVSNISRPKSVVASAPPGAVSRLQQPVSKPRPVAVFQNADSGRERATSNARPVSGGKPSAPVATKNLRQQQPSSYESDTMSAGSDAILTKDNGATQAANRRRLSVASQAVASKQSQQRRHEEEVDSSYYEEGRHKAAAAAMGDKSRAPVRSVAHKHHVSNSNDKRQVNAISDDDGDAPFQHKMAAGYAPPDDEDDDEEEDIDSDYQIDRAHHRNQEDDEEDDEEEGYYDQGVGGLDGTTELIQKTVGLLSAHKLSIAEMVEVMKEEMELVQEMENVDDRDSELYIDKLDRILRAKNEAIGGLRAELSRFQKYRAQSLKGGRY